MGKQWKQCPSPRREEGHCWNREGHVDGKECRARWRKRGLRKNRNQDWRTESSLCFLGSVRLPGCKPWWTRQGNKHRCSMQTESSAAGVEGPLSVRQGIHVASTRVTEGPISGARDVSLPWTLGRAVQPWAGLFLVSNPSRARRQWQCLWTRLMEEAASLH